MADVTSSYGPGEGVWPPPEEAAPRGVRRRLLRLVRPRTADVEQALLEVAPADRARLLRRLQLGPVREAAAILASLGAASCTIAGVHELAGDGWALVAGGGFLLLLERRLS